MSIYKGNNLVAGSGLSANFTPDDVPTEGSQHAIMSGGMYDALLTKEATTNKIAVINAGSTDNQYPSAKAVYDALENHEPIDINYARDLYAPDWSQATAVPQDVLMHGYTVPKRGIFVGSTIPQHIGSAVESVNVAHIRLNDIVIGFGYIFYEDVRVAYVNTPASPGDVLKSDSPTVQDGHYTIYFVPYKRQ